MATPKATAAVKKPAAAKKAPAAKKTVVAKEKPAKKAAPAKKPAAAKKAAAPKKASAKPNKISPEERYRMVEVAAYFLAERSAFAGNPVSYWTAAEAQISKLLK